MVIKKTVEHRLKTSLNVGVDVELVEPGTLPRFEGKSKKVVDRRSL
jgi:phenylacetate-CoA ligase